MILNCLEHEFLKSFLVQERRQSFWTFSILSYTLDLQWCLPDKRKIHSQLSAMFTCRDGKVARPRKCYINRLERFILHHIRNRSTNQIAGNSLSRSEIILMTDIQLINDWYSNDQWLIFNWPMIVIQLALMMTDIQLTHNWYSTDQWFLFNWTWWWLIFNWPMTD